MAEIIKSSNPKNNIVDIAKPSTTVAPANSKSIIVNHGSIMHDPTIIDEDQKSISPVDDLSTKLSHQIKITPTDTDEDSESSTKNSDVPIQPAETHPNKELKLKPSESFKIEEIEPKTIDQPKSANFNKVDHPELNPKLESGADQEQQKPETIPSEESTLSPGDKQKVETTELEAGLAKRAKINDLVDKQTYFVPINGKEKKRNKKVAAIGAVVCLILAVAWLDIALDAGLIVNSYNLPHTHFFTLQ